MFTQYADRHTWVKADFQKLKQYLAGKDLTTNEKIQTLNTLKALFAFTNVHNIS